MKTQGWRQFSCLVLLLISIPHALGRPTCVYLSMPQICNDGSDLTGIYEKDPWSWRATWRRTNGGHHIFEESPGIWRLNANSGRQYFRWMVCSTANGPNSKYPSGMDACCNQGGNEKRNCGNFCGSIVSCTDAPSTAVPTAIPTTAPVTAVPTVPPTAIPTAEPTAIPTAEPTAIPTAEPTAIPTAEPTAIPTAEPTAIPTAEPTAIPTAEPTVIPAAEPTAIPTAFPMSARASLTTAEPTSPIGVPADTPTPSTADGAMLSTPVPTIPELLSAKSTERAGVGAASAAGFGAGAAAGTAMRLVLISDTCIVGDHVRQLPWMFHPTRIKIGGSEPAGAVVGNFSIVVGFTLLMKGVMMVAGLFPEVSRFLKTSDPEGFLRFPSAPLFVFQWFYQGTTLSSMLLLFYPPSVLGFLLGVASCLFCTAVPFVVLVSVHRGVPKEAIYRVDTEEHGWVSTCIVGPGEWVSFREERHWVQRWASVTKTYCEEMVWFSFVDFSASFCLAAMAAIRTHGAVQCGYVKTFQGCIFVALLLFESKYWPHVRMRDSVADFMTIGAQAVALFSIGAGYHYKKHPMDNLFRTADTLLAAASVIVLIKVGLDICTEGYIFITGRRRRLQEAEWRKRSLSNVSSDLVAEPCSGGYSRVPDNITNSVASTELRLTPASREFSYTDNSMRLESSSWL